MNTQTMRRILALQGTVVLVLLVPFIATGAESTSYKLYTNIDESDAAPLGSDSFSLDEGAGTWTGLPLTGSTFQIVTAPPASSVASSSSSVSSDSGGTGGGTTGTSGGGGGRGDRIPGPQKSSSSSSHISTSSSEASVGTPIDANIVPPAPTTPSGDLRPSAGGSEDGGDTVAVPGTGECSGEACVCDCPAQVTEDTHCAATETFVRIPVLIPTAFQNPLPSMLLLIVAYLLGYTSKIVRSGQATFPGKTKTKPRKKK